MPSFNNLKSLYLYIQDQVQDSLKEVSKLIQEEVKQYIEINLYNEPTQSYQRTRELLESISVRPISEGGNVIEFEIYYDTTKINPYINNDSIWNAHADIDGKDVSSLVPLWVEEGTKYPSLYPRKGLGAMENTKNEIENNKFHLVKLQHILSSKGINCVIKG